jgi:GT2 family glycosyltransferase
MMPEIATTAMPTIEQPVMSVVVPARNCPSQLRACLTALKATTYSAYEILVVDDASTDETAAVAEEMGVRCLRREQQAGPAVARNQGAKAASGEYIFFVDADVCVYPETVGRVAAAFVQTQAVAVFGSYDKKPTALNLLSQYKNLCHHFVHQQSREEANSFWSGCGAVRRSIFVELGGFDASYSRPCIEDIELGGRLRKAGHRILLDREIQVTHLKQWSLWGLVKTDVFDRAVPWTQLLLRDRFVPNDLNLTRTQRLSAMLAFLLPAIFCLGAWHQPATLLLPIVGLCGIQLLDLWSARGRITRGVASLSVVAVLTVCWAIITSFGLWSLLPFGLLGGIILLNYRLYLFLARERHPLFAAFAIPLHVGYYLYSGVGLVVGIGTYYWKLSKLAVLSVRKV